jgi:tetratricopeptide (TPR) repeat protein
MDRAIRSDGALAPLVHQYGMSLLAAGRKDRAMQVFRLNRQRHPDDKFWPYVGLARGYTALGDKKRAIENWELALKNVPPSQVPNRARLEQALQALRRS